MLLLFSLLFLGCYSSENIYRYLVLGEECGSLHDFDLAIELSSNLATYHAFPNQSQRTQKSIPPVSHHRKEARLTPKNHQVYNTTFIRWTTHSPPGLSEKDVLMSRFCDEQAKIHGEEEQVESCDLGKELADTVALKGGDCCVPKKEKGK